MIDEFPFVVEPHEMMVACVPGKMPQTVLTIDRQLFNVVVHEYTEPLSWRREWSYRTVDEAIGALAVYLSTPAPEPYGWLRAVDHDEQGFYRMRRSRVEFGERVIVVDDGEHDPWA